MIPAVEANAAENALSLPVRRRTILETPSFGIDRKRDLFEVLVFLIFIVPSMMGSFFAVEGGNPHFLILSSSLIFNDLAYICLIVFFLWRNGEPLADIGWKFDGMKKEAILGAGLFVPLTACVWLFETGLQRLGFSSHMNHLPGFMAFNGPGEIFLACILVIVVAIAEETIFRGYLIFRFRRVTGSLTASVIISSVLFSLGHGYEGPATMATIFVLATIVALIYVWRKSLVAPMVIHLLIDLYPLVLVPLDRALSDGFGG
jgi:membrane protease YdiL (CAAX protease family)